MLRKLHCAALTLLIATAANLSLAETAGFEGPPPWHDSASVYLNLEDTASEATPPARNEPARQMQPASEPPSLSPTPPPLFDSSVRHAFHQTETLSNDNGSQRRLAPPTAPAIPSATRSNRTAATRPVPSFNLPLESITTIVSALGVVLGCFLICTWLVRRGTRKSSAALPRDVVSVLGRVPLATRNIAQLLRVGNKLVLVSLTPAGAETLTEVTDPAEVDRLVGLCRQSDPHSTTKAFEHVFQQMSLEPAPTGFLGREPYRGDVRRG